nr:hypothetical protein [Tanacetum cinerariifolium]
MLVEMIAKRKRFFAAQRAAEQRSKPPTKAHIRNRICTYLKNQAGYNHNQLKGMSYDEIKKLSDEAYKQVNSFVPLDSEMVKDSGKKDDSSSKQVGSRKKRSSSKLKPKSPKKLKVMKEQESAVDEQEKEELMLCLKIVQDEDRAINYETLAVKSLIGTLVCINMLVEKKYPLTKEMLTRMLNSRLEADLKSKELAKPITPPCESAFKEDSDPKQAQRDKDMQKNLALIAKYFKKIYKPTNNNLRTSLNSRNKNMDTTPSQVVQPSGIQCFNCKEFGHFAKECRKPKRVKESTYHKEKMLLCKQAEIGVPLQAEQADWLEDTYEEIDEQELEAHYSFMAKIKEVLPP